MFWQTGAKKSLFIPPNKFNFQFIFSDFAAYLQDKMHLTLISADIKIDEYTCLFRSKNV